MSDISPRGKRILTIAGIGGVIAGLLGWMMWSYGWVGALCLGLIVALLIAFILLWFMPGRVESYNSGQMSGGISGKSAAVAGGAAAAAATAGSMAASAGGSVTSTASGAASSASAAVASTAAKAADIPAKPKAPKVDAPKPAAPKAAAPKAAAPKAAAKKAPAAKATAAKKPAAKKPAASKAAPKAAAAKKEVKPVAADGKPELLKKARAGGADDLKQIKGVGPKMEGMLNDMGVYHFDQVAGWRKKEVQWVDDNLEGFNGRVSRDEWVKQAKVLAKGGQTEFAKKVKKGGVY